MLKEHNADFFVCATGDQTTDAPALREADVGMTVCSGSDFTKSRAGVLFWRNDGFLSTECIIKQGKGLYQSVRKFLQFEMTINFVTLFILMYCAAVYGESAMSGVQIMWINLVMDCFWALALQKERVMEPSEAERTPFRVSMRVATPNMTRNIFWWSFYQISVSIFFIYCSGPLLGIEYQHDDPFYWD